MYQNNKRTPRTQSREELYQNKDGREELTESQEITELPLGVAGETGA